jgi:hypothetical protein
VKSRRDRLARALALNNNLWRLQMMRLAQIESKLAELAEAERATLRAFETGGFEPTLLMRRLQLLTRLRKEAEAARAAELERAQTLGRRAKMTEKLFSRADETLRRDQAAAELRGAIDRAGTDNVRAP